MNLIPLAVWKQMLHRPGAKARVSGQYRLIDADYTGTVTAEATVTKGEPLPPLPRKGLRWKLV